MALYRHNPTVERTEVRCLPSCHTVVTANLLKMGQLADTQQCDVFSILDGCSKISKVKQGVGKQLFIRHAPIYTQHDITCHITDIHCDIKRVTVNKAELQVTHLQNHVTVGGYCCLYYKKLNEHYHLSPPPTSSRAIVRPTVIPVRATAI